ncbi:MAG: ADP-ribosylglycohydrolase family protein, partial [Pirellula sp.]
GDADTNAAVAGSRLGARFGFSGIPEKWVRGLKYRRELETRVENLLMLI